MVGLLAVTACGKTKEAPVAASPETKRDPDQPLAFPAPGKATALATPDDPPARALHLTAMVGPKGIALKTSSGNIGPGCEAVGPGVAVPRVEGDHDFTELARCAARLKREAPSEKTVTISAEPNVSYGVILGVMAALRGAEDGPLFTNVQFGIPR